MRLTELFIDTKGKFVFEQFGISLERRFQVEITTQQICQQYYEQEKEFGLYEVMKDLEAAGIIPTDERDLAFIIYSVSATLNYYFENHGLKYRTDSN